jgi:NAD(P)-dependent dehydrogenase (short-subunit alcohol dehydrogenase family)
MDLKLRDKSVIITAAASGIGLATLRAFAAEGARVLAVDINADQLAEAVDSLPGAQVKALVADVTDAAQVGAMVQRACSEFGRLDILYNNAGGATPTPTDAQGIDDYRRIMALNLDSVYFGIHAALPVMLAQGKGCILATTSGAGMNAATGLAVYGAAKAGVINLIRSIATEYGARGIRANAIAPGPMSTPSVRAWLSGFDDGLARFGAQVPSGRLGTGEDIAHAALFLASDLADYINGAVIPVDGAVHARLSSPQID